MNAPLFPKANIDNDWLVLAFLATGALCIGLVINQFRDRPISFVYQSKEERLNEALARIPTALCLPHAPTPHDGSIDLPDLRLLVETKSGTVLDARPEIFYRFGHIPGALNLPREDFENAYANLNIHLMHQDRSIAVYCSGSSCEDAKLVCNALHKLGYMHVLLFKGGWEEWTKAGLPQER